MNWSIIQNKKEYEMALSRLEDLSQNLPEAKSERGRELLLLGYLIDQYEDKEFPIHYPDPVDAIKVRMDDLGLRASDLLDVFGDRGTASKVLGKQRSLSLSMIRLLADRLSLPESLLIQPVRLKQTKKVKNSTLMVVREPKVHYKKRKH
jgi:HTH-type transcriptional regulator/antitoxin HigA